MCTAYDLYKLKGYKIHIVTDEGEYEGIVKNCISNDQVTLEKAFIMPQREPIGTLHFFIHELEDCWAVEEVLPKKSTEVESKGIVSNIVDYRTLTVNIEKLGQNDKVGFVSSRHDASWRNVSDHEYYADSDDTKAEGMPCEEEEEEEFVLSLPQYPENSFPLDWCVLTEINDDFFDAIKHINCQDVIAVSFEGQSIGRHGQISYIGISTTFCTFLFDIIAMKNGAFEKGLKKVFENSGVEKVIHDCRQASDALYHLYKTSLISVFDTQVADVFVNLNHSKDGKIRSNVNSLSRCIQQYLNLRDEDLYPGEVDCRLLKEGIDWMRHPINNVMKEVAIKNVVLLRELRSVLFKLMQSSYTQAVNVYLRVLRNATAEELELEPSTPDRLPEALLLNGLNIVKCKKFSEPVFPSNMGAMFKRNKESDMFGFFFQAKEHIPKRIMNTSSKPQKKRRSTPNRLVQQQSALISSEDEETTNNEKTKPRRRLHGRHQSLNVAIPIEKISDSKQVHANADFEKISELTLKDNPPNFTGKKPLTEACPREVNDLPLTTPEMNTAESLKTAANVGNLDVGYVPSHTKSVSNTVVHPGTSTAIIESKLKEAPVCRTPLPPCDIILNSGHLNIVVENQLASKSTDLSPESPVVPDNCTRHAKIRYMPAGMLI